MKTEKPYYDGSIFERARLKSRKPLKKILYELEMDKRTYLKAEKSEPVNSNTLGKIAAYYGIRIPIGAIR